MKNKIWFIKATPHWPVGNAGAVIIARTANDADSIADTLGLLDAKPAVEIGKSDKDTEVLFVNTGNY